MEGTCCGQEVQHAKELLQKLHVIADIKKGCDSQKKPESALACLQGVILELHPIPRSIPTLNKGDADSSQCSMSGIIGHASLQPALLALPLYMFTHAFFMRCM
eukprot:3670492-Amphidinium_carterae.2